MFLSTDSTALASKNASKLAGTSSTASTATEVLTEDDKSLEGLLKAADEQGIVLETSNKEKVEGHKKKQLVIREYNMKYNEIKSAKAVISFK